MPGIGEYASIYYAAACLLQWAGCGVSDVSDVQFANAVNMVCDEAELTVQQEALLKRIVQENARR